MKALRKMLIEGRSLDGDEILIDIIGNISGDVLAAYSHGFLTSFETHPNPRSCPNLWASMSLSFNRARRSLVFTAPGDILRAADVSEMLSSCISRSTNASRYCCANDPKALTKAARTSPRSRTVEGISRQSSKSFGTRASLSCLLWVSEIIGTRHCFRFRMRASLIAIWISQVPKDDSLRN